MPSSPTSSLRLEKQADGENTNLWGDKLDQALDKIDAAVAGWVAKPLSGAYALSTANYAPDEASAAMLKFTGTGAFTVTVPAVSKVYRVWNACTGLLTLSNGTGSTTVQPGEVAEVVTDGAGSFARVQPTDYGGARITSVGTPAGAADAATKAYVDGSLQTAVFTQTQFGVPVSPGTAGQFLTNNGAAPAWAALSVANVGDYAADQASRQAAALAQANGFALCMALLF